MAIKYKCLPGHPTNVSVQGKPEEGEYCEHFQLIQSKVADIVDTLPVTDMELLGEVIPSLGSNRGQLCI